MSALLLTPREVEAHPRYRIPQSTSAKMRIAGQGPRFVKRGHRIFYDIGDLETWLESLKHTSTSEYA